jgi:uncharacterized membrane protein
MANAKSKARAQAQARARAQAKKAAARTGPTPVRATPISPAGVRPDAGVRGDGVTRGVVTAALRDASSRRLAGDLADPEGDYVPAGPPRWFGVTTFVLALIGLGISIYETVAHFTGNSLAGCSRGSGAVNCTAVITSSQSMVFGVIPVAILGLAFYLFAVPVMSPWAWRVRRREVGLLRLGSLVVGIGFVVYLVYAEVYQIRHICEYCTGVHVVTFLLFCFTVVAAALWGLGERRARG